MIASLQLRMAHPFTVSQTRQNTGEVSEPLGFPPIITPASSPLTPIIPGTQLTVVVSSSDKIERVHPFLPFTSPELWSLVLDVLLVVSTLLPGI